MLHPVLKHSLYHILEVLAVLILIAIMTFSGFILYVSQTPVEANYVKKYAENFLAKAFHGDKAEIESLKIIWSAPEKDFLISAKNLKVFDSQKNIISNAPKVNVDLSLEALLFGKIKVSNLYIMGGNFSILRNSDGVFRLAFGLLEDKGLDEKTKQSLERTEKEKKDKGLLLKKDSIVRKTISETEWVDTFLDLLKKKFETLGAPEQSIKSIEFRNTDFLIRDKILNLNQRISKVDLKYTHNRKNFSFSFKGKLSPSQTSIKREQGAIITFKANLSPDFKNISLTGDIKNISLKNQFPAIETDHWITGIESLADIHFIINAKRKSGLTNMDLKVHLGKGVYQIGKFREKIHWADIDVYYLAKEKTITVRKLTLNSQKLSFKSKGKLVLSESDLGSLTKNILIKYTLQNIYIHQPKIFKQKLEIHNIQMEGELNLSKRTFDFKNLVVSLFNLKGNFSGKADFPAISSKRQVRKPNLLLQGTISGFASKKEILSAWPVFLEPPARQWVEESISEILVEGESLNLSINQEDWKRKFLDKEDLSLKFKYQYAKVLILDDLPHITEAMGEAELTGNSLHLKVKQGQIGPMQIRNSTLDLENLTSKGTAEIIANLSGSSAIFLQHLGKDPFQFLDLTQFPSLKNSKGDIEFILKLHWPMRYVFDPNVLSYSVEGLINHFNVELVKDFYPLKEGKIRFSVDKESFRVSGNGKVDSVPIEFSYDGSYDQKPSYFTLNTIVNQGLLDGFGIGLRQFAGGEARVRLEAYGTGIKPKTANITVNLKGCDIHTQFWKKKKGEEASLKANWHQTETGYLLKDIIIQDRVSEIRGSIDLGKDGHFIKADFPLIKSKGFSDIKLLFTEMDSGYKLKVNGDYFNATGISKILSNVFKKKTETHKNFLAEINLKEIIFDHDKALSNFQFQTDLQKGHIKSLSLHGVENQEDVTLRIFPSKTGKRRIEGRSSNAGSVLSAFFGFNSIEGGELIIKGVLPEEGNQKNTEETLLLVKSFKLKDAPFMAQLLSIASLKGLNDTLSGEGIAFKLLEVPLLVSGNKVFFEDARVYGPAMGLTATGFINLEKFSLDIQGTLVPSYGVNSFLGEIPILGDLLTSRKGEGIFGLTYTMKGPFEKVQIFINPLSALTPGIFRRIFEGDRSRVQKKENADVIIIEKEESMPQE